MGDVALLAGSPADANDHYSTAVELSRPAQDFVWCAAALEGRAHALVSLASRIFFLLFGACSPVFGVQHKLWCALALFWAVFGAERGGEPGMVQRSVAWAAVLGGRAHALGALTSVKKGSVWGAAM